MDSSIALADDELLREFVNESREHLKTIEADLLTIEEGGANIDEQLVNKVFRAAHSIKGGSSFFGLEKVKNLSHKAETVLDMMRSRKMPANAEVTNVLLAAFDTLRDMMNNITESEQTDIDMLLESLTGLASSYLSGDRKEESRGIGLTEAPPSDVAPAVSQPVTPEQIVRDDRNMYQVACDLVADIEKKGLSVQSFFENLLSVGEIIDCRVTLSDAGTLDGPIGARLPVRLVLATILDPSIVDGVFDTIDPNRIQLLQDADMKPAGTPEPGGSLPGAAAAEPVGTSQVATTQEPKPVPAPPPQKPVPPRKPEPPRMAETAASPGTPPPPDETLRINVGLLETLMNLAGELVLSRNQLRAAVAQNNRTLLSSVNQRVNQVTSELQNVIMQTRLQPIGNVFSKFPRFVRDLSRSLGKEIDLDIRGKEVALDKTLIEGLSDPLTHMVRNAVDHGIETAEARVTAGKRPAGQVRIEARHEAGQVVLEIADDGKGIDPDRIADSAVRAGMITAEKVLGLSDQDKQALVFLPGLSTAQQVSDVSGRGVGMDVVKTNLDRIGGQVEIHSEIGRGSSFRIKLPLTLAIIPSLIISLEDQRFAIPQANIEELLRLRPEEVRNRIEIVGDSEVLLLRDRILPLARFADILQALPTYTDPSTGWREVDRRVRIADRRSPRHGLTELTTDETSEADDSFRKKKDRRKRAESALEIAVVTTGTMSYALVVGTFHDTEEVVVKPLGSRFKKLREYSGATILGDGAVALILDMAGLAAKAGLTSVSGTARAMELAAEAEAQRLQDLYSLLLFENGPGESCAIPLDMVHRIERVTPGQIEHFGSNRTMQYRGGSLPLVALSDVAAVASVEDREDLVVLVSSVSGREVGILGAMPVDVVEVRLVIDQSTHRQKGISGSAIIHDTTTLIADLYELVEAVYPEWTADRPAKKIQDSCLPAQAEASEPYRILLAEDSDFFRNQVKRFLEEEGYVVLAAPDGEAAWELLVENIGRVGIVITDIEMPRLTGLGLAQRIRSDERTARLPVLAVSSLAGDEDIEKGLAVGITEYHVKLDRDSLMTSVHEKMAALSAVL